MSNRLPIETFSIPMIEIRHGWRSATYFNRTKQIMEANDAEVTMQFFQRKDNSVLCGIDEVIAILKSCTGQYEPLKTEQRFREHLANRNDPLIRQRLDDWWVAGWDKLQVKALYDGDIVQPFEPVLQISGPYSQFAHLESVLLGILARGTKVATNVRRVVNAANGKPVLMFADRFDHYATQGHDGFASSIGGAQGWATDAMGAWWGEPGVGTMPHALIAARDGSLTDALVDFAKTYPDVPAMALVDFHNNCVKQSLEALECLGDKLYAVRLDTSGTQVDYSLNKMNDNPDDPFWKECGGYDEYCWHDRFNMLKGVSEPLVTEVRKALDDAGGSHVKIVVSGGFNEDKIKHFERAKVPVDIYAVGENLLSGQISFTADVVKPIAKLGRGWKDDSRLELVS